MQDLFVISFSSDELSARGALKEVMTRLAPHLPAAESAGTLELVLAEVLNNIVEHAYAGTKDGEIQLHCRDIDSVIEFETVDFGVPFPDGRIPDGSHPDLDRPMDQLPEGGFGWMLIRSLASDLRYVRQDDANHLVVRFKLE